MTNASLEQIHSPADLRQLDRRELKEVAVELREFVLHTVSKTGGHLSSNLGTVELTIALHHVFNTPDDRIVWDVGHQSYPHKILTGRREQMAKLRQKDGISGFPRRSESEYDAFGTAHSSTSISAVLGMAVASRNAGLGDRQHIAVIGDGAMTAGMAFEALNNAGVTPGVNVLVVLNDNDMSISPPVGALNHYFARLLSGRFYATAKNVGRAVLQHVPPVLELARRFEGHAKGMVSPATLFEELGFNYVGPIDGHNLDALVPTLENLRSLGGLQFLHVVTKKGQGYKLAEADPVLYHGPGKFDPSVGIQKPKSPPKQTFTQVFGHWLCDMAAADSRLYGITPAMREGSGMVAFEQRFPARYIDAGIAEQHAVTFAAGLACEGEKPVVAIYSTFLQRGYDQLIHDVALQNLDVTFALDRAGIVGADGATHAGNFDIAFLRCIPNMVVAVPSDENETRLLLSTCYEHPGPASVRYPRGAGCGADVQADLETVAIGKAVLRRRGSRIAILAFGPLLHEALEAAQEINATVVDMRFVKPLDEAMLQTLAQDHDGFVTIEEAAIMGGAGSAVLEYFSRQGILRPVLQLGLPDQFIDHGEQTVILGELGLDAQGIQRSTQQRFGALLAEQVIPAARESA
ncbi:1-deoxy-D-xylulose-5-phosphate synthase [Pollutimonas subterranea]|uniref:1-deoxy-D-xylulose-5-phosphate synthase n=1 Tax=Pollutimonas subterranea TaxID=2045210 RepID=A0A2N4U843_9BURK|nr:1-deoxy-D-xylulose-5-phosphate synthase [Pollutimonas subterranea]PLC51183.1 1-deoxy-D-xylulose-5-phosphate synthase [Pollutimonas subterranea]